MENSDLNFQLSKHLKTDLIKGELLNLFENIEMPLLKVLSVMELNGIKLDSKFLSKLSKKFHKELEELEESIFKYSMKNLILLRLNSWEKFYLEK